jgi:hypothetical protein
MTTPGKKALLMLASAAMVMGVSLPTGLREPPEDLGAPFRPKTNGERIRDELRARSPSRRERERLARKALR